MHNELHRHYALLLGVKSPWEVNGVNLDMAGRQSGSSLFSVGSAWERGRLAG